LLGVAIVCVAIRFIVAHECSSSLARQMLCALRALRACGSKVLAYLFLSIHSALAERRMNG